MTLKEVYQERRLLLLIPSSRKMVKMNWIGLLGKRAWNQMNLRSLNPTLLLLHVRVVSKIQKVKLRN